MRAALAGCLFLAGCGGETVALELPSVVAAAPSALIVWSAAGRHQIFGFDPSSPPPASLPAFFDDAPVEVTALALDRPLGELELPRGPIEPQAASGRRMADLPGATAIFVRAIGAADPGAWSQSSALPPTIAELRLPAAADPCSRVRFEERPIDPGTLLDLEAVVALGPELALAGGLRVDSGAVVAVVDRQARVTVRELDADLRTVVDLLRIDDRAHALVERTDGKAAHLELTSDGTVRGRLDLPSEPGERLRLAASPRGPVYAYSDRRVLELVDGATAAVDRSALFPGPLVALAIASNDRMAAIVGELRRREIHVLIGARWRVEVPLNPLGAQPVHAIAADAARMVATSSTTILVRDEGSGRWQVLAEPSLLRSKIGVALDGQGRGWVHGQHGYLRYLGPEGQSCLVDTEVTHYLNRVAFAPDRRTAVSMDDYYREANYVENSRLFWFNLPESSSR